MSYKYLVIFLSVLVILNMFIFLPNIIKADTVLPKIDTIFPTSTVANNNDFNLNIKGNDFTVDSVVYFGNLEKKPFFNSSSELIVPINSLDLEAPGFYDIVVINPEEKKSNIKTFTINSPFPNITKISPASITSNNEGFTLHVIGSNFLPGSIVNINNKAENTTYVSSSQLDAYLSVLDIPTAGSYNITITNPPPGEKISNSYVLNVTNPIPTIKDTAPESVAIGSSKTTLTINGVNFISTTNNRPGSQVYLNNIPIFTIYNSSTQLVAYIPSTLLNDAIDYSVNISNPSPGGGFSNTRILSIKNPSPKTSIISPQSVVVGNPGFDLTIIGSHFIRGATITFNGKKRETIYNSSTKLTAHILASDILTAGNYNVFVINPNPGGGQSNGRIISINNPVPTISSISPKSSQLNSNDIKITVSGSNFTSGSTINFNGSPQKTTYISSKQLTSLINTKNLIFAGLYNITVTNPAPGGGNSTAQTFTVNNPVPTITNVSQNSISNKSPSFFLNIEGGNFIKDTIIYFDGKPLLSSYGSDNRKNQLTVLIEASYIKTPGNYYITAINPAPGGGTSNKKSFTVIESVKDYTYSSFYIRQCRLFSSPIPITSDCQADITCTGY